MVVASRSGTESHRAEPLDDWEALRWRKLEWSDLPKTMYRGLISCLTVREAGRLDCAMTNSEARPHLVKSYKGMQSPAFNGYVYECRGKGCKELQWARKRGIDLRGFTLSYHGHVRSGYVLYRLMGGFSEDEPNLYVATYYATKDKLTHFDEVFGGLHGHTALTWAYDKGYLEIVKCLEATSISSSCSSQQDRRPRPYYLDLLHSSTIRTKHSTHHILSVI